MADSMVALSEVRHGGVDGLVLVFAEGEVVSGLDKDDMDALIAAGAVGTPVELPKGITDQIDELQTDLAGAEAEIQALKAQLVVSTAAKSVK